MRTKHTGKEYRIVIPGKAISFRVPNATEYKEHVAECASKLIETPIIEGAVEVRITYFHSEDVRSDMDNIAKCIMDALNGLAYDDDKRVSLQDSERYDTRKRLYLDHLPLDAIKALRDHKEYVFLRIREIATRKKL